ncbi:MAG: hypothetical protein ABIQ18_12395 [Umezawaea sp.]
MAVVVGSLGPTPEQTLSAIGAVSLAPSVCNSQPWRFRLLPDWIELHADPDRALPVTDPAGRELRLSCGAAPTRHTTLLPFARTPVPIAHGQALVRAAELERSWLLPRPAVRPARRTDHRLTLIGPTTPSVCATTGAVDVRPLPPSRPVHRPGPSAKPGRRRM